MKPENMFIGNKILLRAFAARRNERSLLIRDIGMLEIKLTKYPNSLTRGVIALEGKKIPIVSSQRMPLISEEEVDDKSCILLLSTVKSSRLGVLVSNTAEITKVAREFI